MAGIHVAHPSNLNSESSFLSNLPANPPLLPSPALLVWIASKSGIVFVRECVCAVW